MIQYDTSNHCLSDPNLYPHPTILVKAFETEPTAKKRKSRPPPPTATIAVAHQLVVTAASMEMGVHQWRPCPWGETETGVMGAQVTFAGDCACLYTVCALLDAPYRGSTGDSMVCLSLLRANCRHSIPRRHPHLRSHPNPTPQVEHGSCCPRVSPH